MIIFSLRINGERCSHPGQNDPMLFTLIVFDYWRPYQKHEKITKQGSCVSPCSEFCSVQARGPRQPKAEN